MFAKKLTGLKGKELLRHISDRDAETLKEAALLGTPGTRINAGGRLCVSFASNDYLALSAHPALIKAAEQALRDFGAGAGASRLLRGGCHIHAELEAAIRDFKGTEAALLFNSGYAANTSVIPALAGEGDEIFSDALNHASLIDGCRLSRARVHVYRHADAGHLRDLLKASGAQNRLVVTDTVFSMHGDLAPVKEIASLCEEHGALMYLDDAHGTGVLKEGRGALAHFGVKAAPHIIQMGTFSKALGSFGAFVAASEEIVQWLVNSARGLIYSTALPPHVVAASLAAVGLLAGGQAPVDKLWENTMRLSGALRGMGLDTGGTQTPIIPILLNDNREALSVSERLLKEGFFAPAIRPPSVPGALIRISVTAAHTEDELESLISTLGSVF